LGNTLPKAVDGSKAHSKGRYGWWLEGTLKKRQGWKTHYLRWLMALRRTQKEAGLENTLPKVVDGSKAHSKGGRVGKHTTYGG
jgi:hypothetical protein